MSLSYKLASVFVLSGIFISTVCPKALAATADPNASSATRQVLDYLQGLTNKPDRRLISGQMIWRQLGSSEYDYATFQNTYNATGHYPGIVGAGPTNNDDVLNQFVKDYSNKGGIVTMMFLARNAPQRWNWSGGSIDLAEMIRPGGENNDRYMQILDDASLALQRYQDAGIVVLFRPYLEMNGSWTWFYGDHAKYIALWRHIFNYFTYVKGLHNLLWVYSPNGGVGDYLGYYPGDQYVDIVGLDWYQYNNGPMGKVGGYDELTSLGKPFAMTEYGPLDTSATAVDPQDYALFIQGIKQNMPKTVYWMAWGTPYGISNQSNISAALNDPWVVNRDGITIFSTTPPPPPPLSGSCTNFWNSTLAVPASFGASFNLFSGLRELLMTVYCSASGASLNVGNGSTYEYIYKTGYILQNNQWTPFNYSGSNLSSDDNWYTGNATHDFSLSSQELSNKQSVLAYICEWTGTWKCGCNDSSCSANYWNLQQFKQ